MTNKNSKAQDGGERVVVRRGEATDKPSVLRAETTAGPDGGVIPIVEEVARIEKRVVDKGSIRVSTDIETVTEQVETTLREQSATLDRVRHDRIVDAMPEPRLEGDTIIVPIVEERVVVTKQLVLVEEVHVKLNEATRTDIQEVPLRKERVRIDEIPATDEAADLRPAPTADGDNPAHPER